MPRREKKRLEAMAVLRLAPRGGWWSGLEREAELGGVLGKGGGGGAVKGKNQGGSWACHVAFF